MTLASARKRSANVVDHGFRLHGIGDVRGQEANPLAELALQVPALLLTPSRHDDPRALLDENLGDPLADAARAAGDDGDLAVEHCQRPSQMRPFRST